MRKFYVFIISDKDNKNLFVGTATEVLDFLDKYQNQPGRNQDFPHANDKLVYYESFDDAGLVEKRKFQIVLAEDKEKRGLINKFNPHWDNVIVKFTKEESKYAENQTSKDQNA